MHNNLFNSTCLSHQDKQDANRNYCSLQKQSHYLCISIDRIYQLLEAKRNQSFMSHQCLTIFQLNYLDINDRACIFAVTNCTSL